MEPIPEGSFFTSIPASLVTQKLNEAQLKPWQQGVPQSLDHWTMFFAAIVPALAIVRATISLIIHTRGSEVMACLVCVCVCARPLTRVHAHSHFVNFVGSVSLCLCLSVCLSLPPRLPLSFSLSSFSLFFFCVEIDLY